MIFVVGRAAAALALVLLVAGCGAPATRTARAAAPVRRESGRQALLDEVRAELGAMRVTRYQHDTEVDASRGEYFYDCSGFVDYALTRARPADESALPVTPSAGRPLAQDYEHYLRRLHPGTASPTWDRIAAVRSLRPGDVIAWLVTPDSRSRDTGHVMVVLADPTPDPHHTGEWLIHVADSTTAPHDADSRHGTDGLGTGTIGLTTDTTGHPTAFLWRGPDSPSPRPTDIALGQPR